ncbi:hypothetical protein ACFX1T_046634 [Malus domestica]
MPASIKICTRRSFKNRKGACSEIEEAFAFSKAGLLRDHEGRSQKSKTRLLSQKLGCSKTTKADLRNRRGACFLKSWAAQKPRGPILEIEEAPAFSALSAPVTCTLSFAEITGILSKIFGEVESTWILLFNHSLSTRNISSWVPQITLPKISDKV